MYATNRRLAQLFKQMSTIYTFMDEKNRFRALAYDKAARVIGNMEDDISKYSINDLEAMKGIGHGIASRIDEFVKTGKIDKYEELKSMVPFELMDLVSVQGIGPSSIKTMHEELNVTTRKEFIDALIDGRAYTLKGFGKKKVENMIKGLEMYKAAHERIILWDAMELGGNIIDELKKLPVVQKIELAGSIRRRNETIGDVDILISCRQKDRSKVVAYFTQLESVKKILVKGNTKASVIIEDYNRQVDLRVVLPEEWGAALLYFTGSKQHNIHLRSIAKGAGYKLSEYGIFNLKDKKRMGGETEEEIYQILGMQWIPPELREDAGEIEVALRNDLPHLVEIDQIKGDLQMHSEWTDGYNTIEEITAYVKKNYKYDYIAMSDHSSAVKIAGGIGEVDLLKQIEEIKAINLKLGNDFIKTGIEVDINIDGSLDMSDELLSQLDWVVAAIHSNFHRDITDRLVKACENPYVHVIGHPTCRLIGTREACSVNLEKVMDVAKETGTALEINAQPERMDLNDKYVRMAVNKGVKLVISTDSHVLGDFNCMELGIAIARKGWCTKEDILNTKSWDEIMKFFQMNKMKAEKAITI